MSFLLSFGTGLDAIQSRARKDIEMVGWQTVRRPASILPFDAGAASKRLLHILMGSTNESREHLEGIYI